MVDESSQEAGEAINSPIHDRHVAARAKFAEFGGWNMPLEYTGAGILVEHRAVRTGVGIFDVSHLGKIEVQGSATRDFLNRILTNDVTGIDAGQAQYTLMCDEAGGIVDDLITYVRGEDNVLLMPNAANSNEVVRRLKTVAPSGVTIVDQHQSRAVFAVQGTHSDEVLASLGLPVGHRYMSFVDHRWQDVTLTVCRSGYTGERGYELIVPVEAAGEVWDAVMAAGEPYGIQRCGLGARDTLRTEMGYPLHGQDLSTDVDPVAARLVWAVGWDKADFVGRAALQTIRASKPPRVLRGLRARGRGIPRPGMKVQAADGHQVGHLTSGTFSPTLKQGIGLAMIDRDITVGTVVIVEVRTRQEEFEVVRTPFVEPSVRET